MNISNVKANITSTFSTPNFKGNVASKVFELVGGEGVFKNATRFDVENFKSYIASMPFKMGITSEDVAALSRYDGKEFVENAYQFCAKRIGLPNELCPPLLFGEIVGQPVAGYKPGFNTIIVDLNKINNLSCSKNQLFGLIRHELQHTMQYYSILRHEQLGQRAVEVAGDNFANNFELSIKTLLKTYPIEDVEKLCIDCGDNLSYEAVQRFKNNDIEGFEKLCEFAGNQVREQVTNLRQALLEKSGPIKKDSALTPQLAKFFDELHGNPYYKDDTSISISKYMDSSIESDAILAQIRADFEFTQEGCYMKYQREQFKKILDNGEFDKFMEQMNAG